MANDIEKIIGKAPKRESDVQKDQLLRQRAELDIKEFFEKILRKKVPSFKKGKGFVTSRRRDFSKTKGHREYGALDIAANVIGNRKDQQKFIEWALNNGYTVIDETKAISQKRGTPDRGIFHIDKRPGNPRLIEEVPIPGKVIGKYTTVKSGEISEGGFLAPKSSKSPKPSKPSIPFKQAFEEARAEGKKEFTWKGNRYNTIRKEDLVKEEDLRGPEMQRDQYLEDQDDDLTEEIVNIKEEAKKGIVRDPYYGSEVEMPQPEIEPEEMPLDSPEPFGIYAKGTEEFDIAEEQEKDKLMMAAHGGEVKHYEEGGEVYDIPEYLQRPEEDIVEEDFRIEQVVDEPELEPDLSGPEFDRDQYLLEQKSTQELMDTSRPGVGRPPQVNRELIRRKREAESGFEVGEGPKLREIAVEEKEEIVKVPKPEKAPEPPRLSKLDFLQIRQLKDEKELRKAEDEAIKQAQQMSTIDPKRFYKNQSTFDKIVSLVGLAAGAYGSYKYGSPNTFIQRLDKEVEKDIRAQALDAKLEQQKLAASNFKISVLAKRLARSTKDADKQQKFLDVARTYQTKAFGIVKKQIKKKKDMADLSQLNKRGITDEELAYLTVNFPKMKIEDTVIKGRDGLNYKVRGGVSRANKVKEYVSDAQSSLDGLNELLTYVDKVTIFEQGALNPFAALFSTDRAKADSLRDRLVGSLRIEFFGPGVMTDQERENAKKILGDPNAFWTTDVREKAKVRSLIMKLNYGVRNKLRQDGLALPLSPNDQRIKQILERRRLSDNAANRVKVIDGLIRSETDSIENGNRPGQFWDINEPLPI
jgi:hypothetical protein